MDASNKKSACAGLSCAVGNKKALHGAWFLSSLSARPFARLAGNQAESSLDWTAEVHEEGIRD